MDLAVERSRCHDGIDLPLPVRSCLDYVECHGLMFEGVYKIGGTKSKVVHLKKMYNHRENVNLSEYDIPVVTSLLKIFLRYLIGSVKILCMSTFVAGICLNQFSQTIYLLDLRKLVLF